MLAYIWPMVLIIASNTVYQSCSKGVPRRVSPFASLTPPEVIDSLVVHELCHRKEVDLSPKFYAEVLRVCPDYQKWHDWLKQNGPALMRRIAP